MENSAKFSEKVIAIMMKFVNLKGVIALKDGLLAILPLTVVGSIFLVIANIPYPAINTWLASMFGLHWTEPFMQVYGATFELMGLVACFAVAYSYVKNEGYVALPAGVLSIASFIIITNSYVISPKGEKVTDVISKTWTGGQGMVTAIIIGLVVGATYSWFMRKKIVIKMPDSVPPAVANQFTALVPAVAIFTGSLTVYSVFKFGLNTTFVEWIYKAIQVPLQGLTDSLPGVIGIAFFISFLWWFGIHGQSVVNGIVTSLLTANAMENANMLKTAGSLSVSGGAHIVTQQFLDQFIIVSGSGITFGIVFGMLFAAKSQQYKTLGKLSIFPALFNINEPVTFGFPIVLNPFMFIPFILVPVLSSLLVYVSIATGFLHPFSGVLLPWSTPAIISGFLVAGWKGALIQILILVISVVVYFPFFRKQDQLAYKQEQENMTTQENHDNNSGHHAAIN